MLSEEHKEKLSKANQKPWSDSRHKAQEEWRKNHAIPDRKVCHKCDIEKSLSDFSKSKGGKYGVSCRCKACESEHKKKYYTENIEEKKSKHKEYCTKNKDKNRERYYRNIDKIKAYKKEWSQRPDTKEHRKKKNTERRLNDPTFRLKNNLRSRLGAAIKNNQKVGSAVRDLGCTIEELKLHLESKFQAGMVWDNYGCGIGKWSIDHMIPLDSFDLTDREQLLKACHYSNLQPLWVVENSSKGNKTPSNNLPKEPNI